MISMKNQVKKNLEKSDSSMDNDDNKYKCKKCKDVTYILTEDVYKRQELYLWV